MGNVNAKRSTKEEKEKKKENRMFGLTTRKQQIENIETQFYKNTIASIKNGTNDDDNILVMKNFTTQMTVLEKSKEQLNRGGAPFTKADLIAIICYIEPQYLTNLEEIKKHTVEDLNAIIRLVIYDPSHYNKSPVQMNQVNPNYKINGSSNTSLVIV